MNHNKAVKMSKSNGESVVFESAKEASDKTGVSRGMISRHANGKFVGSTSRDGVMWEFV